MSDERVVEVQAVADRLRLLPVELTRLTVGMADPAVKALVVEAVVLSAVLVAVLDEAYQLATLSGSPTRGGSELMKPALKNTSGTV